MAAITVRAFAKINLSLQVEAARPDGYHAVRTILQAIDLSDTVSCRPRRGPFEIRCDAPGVPTDATNLVWKAARFLWQAAGREGEPRDAVVTLEKRIPAEAGLGGGSSDAVAALKGLSRVWRVRLGEAGMHAVAAQVGSDVPYFLVGGTALGLGRGEEVYPLEDLPRHPVVLVFPPFGVSTRDAYGWLDESRAAGRAVSLPDRSRGHDRRLFPWLPFANDLEAPVVARHPVIGEVTRRLQEAGARLAAMSGSGSTVFGVFDAPARAAAAARQLKTSGFRVVRARFLPRRRG